MPQCSRIVAHVGSSGHRAWAETATERLMLSALVLGIGVLALGGRTAKGLRTLTGPAKRRAAASARRRPATFGQGALRPAAAV